MKNKQSGFSAFEATVALAALLVMILIVMPAIFGANRRANERYAVTTLQNAMLACANSQACDIPADTAGYSYEVAPVRTGAGSPSTRCRRLPGE